MSEDPAAAWRSVARRTGGDDYAQRFAARFDTLAATGQDVHGEAAFVRAMLPPGGSVLDAGCGTGRIGERLRALSYDVVGADVDQTMVEVARERCPDIPWHVVDLGALQLDRQFDAIVMAGNVVPFVAVERLPEVLAALAGHLVEGAPLICGFGLDGGHLPPGAPVVPLAAYDAACAAAGLELTERFAGWAREPYVEAGGYAVSVHRRAPRDAS